MAESARSVSPVDVVHTNVPTAHDPVGSTLLEVRNQAVRRFETSKTVQHPHQLDYSIVHLPRPKRLAGRVRWRQRPGGPDERR